MKARSHFFRRVLAAVLLTAAFGIASLAGPGASQALAADAPAAPPAAAANNADEPKPVDKIYAACYAIVGLMFSLGVLVICQSRGRADRPELPQETLAERLRATQTQQAQKRG